MAMMTVLIQFLALIWVFLLPGMWVAVRLGDDWPFPLKVAVGFTIGLLTVPLASFCAAWIVGASVNPLLVVVLATVVNAAGATAFFVRRHKAKGNA